MTKPTRQIFVVIAMGIVQNARLRLRLGVWKSRVPRVSDNRKSFQSKLVTPYKRRSEGLDCLFPKLFVEGLATRDG